MDAEDTKQGSHPPADLSDCLGTGIKGIVSDIEEVNPRDVLDDICMPHFVNPCPKSHIVTAKDAEGHHHLLHNRQLLDAALRRDDGTIRTEFYAVPSKSGVALMAVRFSLPFCANGEVSYSEHLRNIRVMEDELIMMGAERGTHGGDRLSIDFPEEQAVSLAAKLAELTGKSVKTMKNWLTFTELLSVEALQTLVAWNCRRSVYEAIQPAKRDFIRGLQGRGLTKGGIIEAVSQKVLELAERYLEGTREREARSPSRREASNGRTHKADGPARANGNGTDSTYVESREDNAAQQAEGTEQKRSPREEQSDEKGRLAESLRALDARLAAKVGKLMKNFEEAPRDLGGIEVREKLLGRLFDTVMEGKRDLDEISLEAPNPSEREADQAEDGS